MKMGSTLLASILLLLSLSRTAAPCSLLEVECDGQCRAACDSHIECSDGSDESPLLCKERNCPIAESIAVLSPFGIDRSDLGDDSRPFRCAYGGCISPQFLCNGHMDCWDGSDETEELCLPRTCPKRTFRCKYGGCLKRLQTCDGKAQCFDGSDEDPALCKKKRCYSRHFQCAYGACIRKEEKCDGNSDCFDSSDETPELCGPDHTFTKTESRIRVPPALASFLNPHQPTTAITQPPPPPPTTTQPPPHTNYHTATPTTTNYHHSHPHHQPPHSHPHQHNTTQPTTTPTTTPPPPPTTPQSPSPSPTSTESDFEAPFPSTKGFPGEDVHDCDGVQSCPCPPPLQHFCVPCNAWNETCARIEEEEVCLMPSRGTLSGIEVEVLSCGANPFLSLAGMVRADRECGTSQGVPVLTVATADCWGAVTLIAECHADGLWYPYGEPKSAKPMRHLCQPHALNADVCGKRARYVRPPGRYVPYETASLWPWLAGLFRHEKYACAAALVSPFYLLTAAHCLTRSQETSQETLDLRDLRVQHLNERGNVIKGYVTAVHLYPAYEAAPRPSATSPRQTGEAGAVLPKAGSRVRPNGVFPEARRGREFLSSYQCTVMMSSTFKYTFNRTVARYRWEMILQQHDPRCHSPHDRCATALTVDRDQFCGIDREYQRYLPQGSSGGPYLVNLGTDADEKWTVVGVVSSSYGEASCSRPYTIFTAVGNYWPWIERCVYLGNCSQPLEDDGE
nr:uncharacterized protein LOC113811499 [Penaeus vannamei]